MNLGIEEPDPSVRHSNAGNVVSVIGAIFAGIGILAIFPDVAKGRFPGGIAWAGLSIGLLFYGVSWILHYLSRIAESQKRMEKICEQQRLCLITIRDLLKAQTEDSHDDTETGE